MTNSDYSMVVINKLVKEGYFKSEEDALLEATNLLLKQHRILKLRERLDKTAESIGYLKGKPLSKLIEEIHEKEEI